MLTAIIARAYAAQDGPADTKRASQAPTGPAFPNRPKTSTFAPAPTGTDVFGELRLWAQLDAGGAPPGLKERLKSPRFRVGQRAMVDGVVEAALLRRINDVSTPYKWRIWKEWCNEKYTLWRRSKLRVPKSMGSLPTTTVTKANMRGHQNRKPGRT